MASRRSSQLSYSREVAEVYPRLSGARRSERGAVRLLVAASQAAPDIRAGLTAGRPERAPRGRRRSARPKRAVIVHPAGEDSVRHRGRHDSARAGRRPVVEVTHDFREPRIRSPGHAQHLDSGCLRRGAGDRVVVRRASCRRHPFLNPAAHSLTLVGSSSFVFRSMEKGDDRNRTGVDGFAGRCVATPPRRPGHRRVAGTGAPVRRPKDNRDPRTGRARARQRDCAERCRRVDRRAPGDRRCFVAHREVIAPSRCPRVGHRGVGPAARPTS
jgi:hypothetical protein